MRIKELAVDRMQDKLVRIMDRMGAPLDAQTDAMNLMTGARLASMTLRQVEAMEQLLTIVLEHTPRCK